MNAAACAGGHLERVSTISHEAPPPARRSSHLAADSAGDCRNPSPALACHSQPAGSLNPIRFPGTVAAALARKGPNE